MSMHSPHARMEILLIEDSKGDALLIEKALISALPEQHHLVKAASLTEALDVLATHRFDVALLDRSLPDAEGYSGLHSIQNRQPQLPVIYLTAFQGEEEALEMIEKGAQDYLYKDQMDGRTIKRAIQYAILRKQFEEALITRANYDMLTGLANRLLFENRLALALAKIRRQGGNMVVLFLDLDDFKKINDTLGHKGGDQALQEMGNRLKSVLRPYDTAARFGGDEFAVLLEDLPDVALGEAVAEKIIRMAAKPFRLCGKEHAIGVSIGIAGCTGEVRNDPEELMRQADEAMYAAKSRRGSYICAYDALDVSQKKLAS